MTTRTRASMMEVPSCREEGPHTRGRREETGPRRVGLRYGSDRPQTPLTRAQVGWRSDNAPDRLQMSIKQAVERDASHGELAPQPGQPAHQAAALRARAELAWYHGRPPRTPRSPTSGVATPRRMSRNSIGVPAWMPAAGSVPARTVTRIRSDTGRMPGSVCQVAAAWISHLR